MAFNTLLTASILVAVVAAPAAAEQTQRSRPRQDGNPSPPAEVQPAERARAEPQRDAQRQSERPQARERAVPREVAPTRNEHDNRRTGNNGRYDSRSDDNNRRYESGRYGYRNYDTSRYAPRIIRPSVVRVVPYSPYVYRPSYRGGYYGTGGAYVYGPTPRGYYDPLPGRYYGGVRITGAPRNAEVFADGYYVGIVNDFDGIFQHVNLEAGRHHIEIDWGGYQPIAFDVYVRPGETTTFRADGYFRP